jgi:SSS family solute:Na+ symporter
MNWALNPAFTTIDLTVLIVYLAAMVAMGSMFYRKKSDTKDYFLAGRNATWVPVAISIIATDFSAISYLGQPAYVWQKDLRMFLMLLMLPCVVVPIVVTFFVPFYSRLNLYTAYEYLERRFGVRVRTVTSLLFLILRGTYMGIIIYAPSLVVSVVTGLPLLESILLMGLLTTIYTALGGMRAVIWTDVVQFIMIVLGFIVIAFVAYSHIGGGWGEIWSTAHSLGKTKLVDFSFDLRKDFTFWSIIFGSGFFLLNTYGTDQIIMQRYLTTPSLEQCKKALKLEAYLLVPEAAILQFIGLLLAVYYFKHPELGQGITMKDAVLPYFTIHELPAGLSGLVIASIFAAAMSTMSGGINSLTTATVVDFYKRLLKSGATEGHYLRVARIVTVAWGTIATGIALFANRLGELANAYNKVNSFLGGVILGIFLLGMLTRRGNEFSVLAGAALGLLTVIIVASTTTISWLWFGLIGCSTTFLCGYAISLPMRSPEPESLSGLVMTNERKSS